MKVEGLNARKVTKSDFRKKILFGPNSPKWGIFGPEIDFFRFFSKKVDKFFLIFGFTKIEKY